MQTTSIIFMNQSKIAALVIVKLFAVEESETVAIANIS